MNQKRCTTCNEEKPASEFSIRAASPDGLCSRCKSCQSAYDRSRANNPKRVEARKAYQNTDRGREASNRAKKKYIRENQFKRAAHVAVGNALRDGKLTKQCCEVCSNPRAEAHHDDYTKPLEVRWLCSTHHKARHAELRKIENGPSPMTNENQALTRADLAKRWNISIWQINQLRKQGKLPRAITVGARKRFLLADVIAFENLDNKPAKKPRG